MPIVWGLMVFRVENLVLNVGRLGVNDVTKELGERGVDIEGYPGKKVLFPEE
jgi:hypothetical protein